MEFLLLGGMILLMGILDKVDVFKKANRLLIGLKLPIGIVVLFVGLSSFAHGAKFVFPGVMGVIAGVFLIMDLLKLIPQAEEGIDKVDTTLISFQVPVGIITVLSAIIGLFMR